MMIKFHSSACYRAIRESNFLVLPSETTLYSYMVPKREAGISHVRLAELSTISSRLSSDENEVSVIFDEMSIQPNVNFDSGGSMKGFAVNKPKDSLQLATSMLSFMVQGLRKNFHEVVAFYPIHNLDSEFLQSCLFQVLHLLMKAGFNPILSVCDNYSTNQKLYRQISGKNDEELKLDPRMPNPYDASETIILSHDPVHILKCIRNNWFRQPTWAVSDGENISWSLLQTLLDHEKDFAIRKAHNLTQKGINHNFTVLNLKMI